MFYSVILRLKAEESHTRLVCVLRFAFMLMGYFAGAQYDSVLIKAEPCHSEAESRRIAYPLGLYSPLCLYADVVLR